ncbi:MAG: translational machinery protein [Alphaproteobacteria bacterium]|nr:translational machinery protein [Alphaproteobacteria bacterium]
MSGHHHAAIWIDHLEARVFFIGRNATEAFAIHPHDPTRHIHHKANSIGSGHAKENQAYFHDVAQSVADASAVLIMGPANAKIELVKHIHHHDPKLMDRIVGIETVNHPTDGELVDHARRYFRASDRLPHPPPNR